MLTFFFSFACCSSLSFPLLRRGASDKRRGKGKDSRSHASQQVTSELSIFFFFFSHDYLFREKRALVSDDLAVSRETLFIGRDRRQKYLIGSTVWHELYFRRNIVWKEKHDERSGIAESLFALENVAQLFPGRSSRQSEWRRRTRLGHAAQQQLSHKAKTLVSKKARNRFGLQQYSLSCETVDLPKNRTRLVKNQYLSTEKEKHLCGVKCKLIDGYLTKFGAP